MRLCISEGGIGFPDGRVGAELRLEGEENGDGEDSAGELEALGRLIPLV